MGRFADLVERKAPTQGRFADLAYPEQLPAEGIYSHAKDLVDRFGMQLYNKGIAGTIKSTLYRVGGGPIMTFVAAHRLNNELEAKGLPRPSIWQTQGILKQHLMNQFGSVIPSLEVPEAKTIPEKVVNVGAGVTSFIAQLALARKVMPTGTPEPVIWEAQNLANGGTPGMGMLMQKVYSLPAKSFAAIRPVTKAGRIGKITAQTAAESALLGGITAAEQQAVTGEVDWTDVAISAGIPVGFLAVGSAGRALRRAPKQKAITEVSIEDKQKAITHLRNLADVERAVGNKKAAERMDREAMRLHQEITTPAKKPIEATTIEEKPYAETTKEVRDFYRHKLINPELADKAPVFKTYAGFVAAVPIGKSRKSGGFDASFTNRNKAAAIANRLKGKKGFPNLRIEKYEDAYYIEWGEKVTLPKTAEEQGKLYGYTKKAISDFSKLSTEIDFEDANQRLLEWSSTAKKLRKEEVEPEIHKLRIRQAKRGTEFLQKALGKGKTAWKSLEQSIAGYKDKANVPEINPPDLTDAQWEMYAGRILKLYPQADYTHQFARTEAQQSLKQLRLGKIPTNRQFERLEEIMGRKVTEQLFKDIAGQRPFDPWDVPRFIIQAFKSIFGLDVQFARQASSFVAREPKEYGKGLVVATKAYGSEKFAVEVLDQVRANPNHKDAVKYINFLSRAPYATEQRAEWFQFGLGEALAKVGAKRGPLFRRATAPLRGYGRLLLASERSMVASTDNFLQNLWDKQTEIWSNERNVTPARLEKYKENYGKTLNTFIKLLRSKSPQGRAIMKAANYVLFSPSMTFSRPLRIKALLANKGTRGYAAQLTATEIGKIFAVSSLVALVGNYLRQKNPNKEPVIDSEMNPLSGNWGKIKVKNTWYDFMGGDAQFYRTIARLGVGAYLKFQEAVTGQIQTRVGKYRIPGVTETFTGYGRTRETAAIGFAKQLFTGKDFMDKPIGRIETLVRGITTEIAQSMYDALASDGLLQALAAGAASTYSVGIQTYPTSAYRKEFELKDKVAQEVFRKDWDELSPSSQRVLTARFPEIARLEKERARERFERGKPEKISLKEQAKVSRKIYKDLPDDIAAELDRLAILVPGLGRRIGKDWYLNDKRYNQYINQVTTVFNAVLPKMIRNPNWDRLSDEQKEAIIKRFFNQTTDRVRQNIIATATAQDVISIKRLYRKTK